MEFDLPLLFFVDLESAFPLFAFLSSSTMLRQNSYSNF
jgi:hypothetical protein